MLLDRIDITGYKRLQKSTVYVGRRTVALVGPNEAGKTSVLSALRLFENGNPVQPDSLSRADIDRERRDTEYVVSLWFRLSKKHLETMRGLPLAVRPTHYRRHKRINGQRVFTFSPLPVVDSRLRDKLAEDWDRVTDLVREQLEAEGIEPSERDGDLASVGVSLMADDVDENEWQRIIDILRRIPAKKLTSRNRKLLDVMETYGTWTVGGSVQVKLKNLLEIVEPEFAMFGDLERGIASEYNIDDDATTQSIALANLLAVGGVPLDKFKANRGNRSYIAELVDRSNSNLQNFFQERWSQEKIAVGLEMDGDILRVFVKDLRAGSVGWLNITDRSDGLRMFVALATFLARRDYEVPPILLIDEAEQHLHLNAQADLVRLLQNLPEIQQVIYTTHSPGCLPADLGNGVRFVEPLSDGTSVIRHDFWSLQNDGHIGFNPLLIVMGAGAAAFSGLRNALFVEGASDMLLLPTLIKLAIGEAELQYQIAPGISVASKSDMENFDLAASRVGFVVDGDEGGRVWGNQLKNAGTPAQRIKYLTGDQGLEDLLDRDYYLRQVNAFLGPGRHVNEEDLGTGPIKTEVAAWATINKIKLPGPVALVEHMLGAHERGEEAIVLNQAHRQWLRGLHKWAHKTLSIDEGRE